MTRRDIVLSLIAVGAIVGAGVFAARNFGGSQYNEGLDRLSYWTCRNNECGAEFEITLAEFGDLSEANDGHVPCPDCGKLTTSRASLCPHCSEPIVLLAHGRMPDRCPHCEQLIGMGRGAP